MNAPGSDAPDGASGASARWDALEAMLEASEAAYRRERVSRDGAAELPAAEAARLHDALRGAVALYLDADAALRERMRAFFRRTDRLARYLDDLAHEAAAAGDEPSARLALGAISLGDVPGDFRDTLPVLGRLHRALVRRGFSPAAVFAEVAALSSETPSRAGGGSTRAFLRDFEQSAWFREQGAPTVRDARPDDVPGMARLLDALGYPCTPEELAARLDAFTAAGERALVAVRPSGGALLGLLTLHVTPVLHRTGPVGRLTLLVVDEAVRGQGVGRSLVEAGEAWLAERGCVLVEVTSNRRRSGAHAFYERLGYEATSLRFGKTVPPRA